MRKRTVSIAVLFFALLLLLGAGKGQLAQASETKLVTKNNKVYCYVDGKKVKNSWKTIDGKKYHFGKKGAADTGYVKIKKKYYDFNKMGVMQTGFVKFKKGYRYFSPVNGRQLTGWQTIGGQKYHFLSTGFANSGLKKLKGKHYYFGAKGIMRTGWIKLSGGKKYYFSLKDGHMFTGKHKIDGKTYYFRSTGVMVKDDWVGGNYYDKNGVLDVSKKSSIGSLKSKLTKQISGYYGTWSVYVKNLKTGESFTINNQQMYAASLIKLFAMGAAYQKVHDGKLSESAISGLIPTMIADSDNSAFNSVVKNIGLYTVNNWCNAHGYTQTTQVHGLSPAYNNSGIRTSNGSNMTSVRDCGMFLESVYKGTCVSKKYSRKMLSALKLITRDKQLYYRSKLPAGVPGGVTVANKTGDLNDYSHDCAIVYSKGADYVIAVMAKVPGRGYSSSSGHAAIARTVYNYFN